MFHRAACAVAAVVLLVSPAARAAVVSETFGTAKNAVATHPGKLTITAAKAGSVIAADLSAIPAGAKVHRASLVALRGHKGLEDRQSGWLRPVRVLPIPPGGDAPAGDAKPLGFQPPWFRSFDVTEPVAKALAAKAPKVQFLVQEFYRWIPDATALEVTFEGKPQGVPPQVTGVQAFHADGNTFITWKETDQLVSKDEITVGELVQIKRELTKKEKTRLLRYRVLRHVAPITAENAASASVLAEVAPLSCANPDGGLYHWGRKKETQNRFVIQPGKGKLPWGTGLYVHTYLPAAGRQDPKQAGTAYYAVATVINGRANLKDLSPANAPTTPVREKPTPYPVPVLQLDAAPKDNRFGGVRRNARVRLYVTWNAEPFTNLPNMAYNWCVAIDEKQLADPAPLGLYLHEWGGTHVRTTWGWPGGRTGILVTGNDYPPQTWWYGWHEAKWTSRSWGEGKVHNYTERRVLALLDWVATQWPVDPKRVFASGGSMGGAGVYTFALRQGQRFAMVSGNVGVANWTIRGHFTTSLETCTGYLKWPTPASDAPTVAERVNMTRWLRENPAVETPFLNCGNGKNDGAIGWPQALGFFRALQETQRPHAAHWGLYGHGTGGVNLRIDEKRHQGFRLDQTLPAFAKCSLDNDIGTGAKRPAPTTSKRRDGQVAKDAYDGDGEGCYNAHLRWETAEKLVTDTPQAWEMTFLLDKWCKADRCTVDVTPRRCQRFKVKPGGRFKWTATSVEDEKQVQSGTATADKHGLVTMEKVTVLKTGSRVRLAPAK